jgi:hypothetical protein
VFKNVKQEK